MTRDEQWLLDEKYGGKETKEFETDKKRLAFGEPLGYVIGWQPFLNLKIYLDSKPLIPRPETEWWTEQLMLTLTHMPQKSAEERAERDDASQSKFPAGNYAAPKMASAACATKFLDLCAGSGAVGCAALAKLPNAHIYFGEIDPAHEKTISKNIRENDLDESRVDIRIGDLFEPFDDIQFDIIAINPPYIPNNRVLPESVALYESEQALRSGADGLDLIRRIAIELPQHLAQNGHTWIECDSAHAAAACALFKAQNFSAEIRTDQYGQPRIIDVQK